MPSKVRATTKTSVTSKSGKSRKKTGRESEDEPSDHYRQSKLESTMLFTKQSVDSSSTTPPASPIKKSVVIQDNDDDEDLKLPTPVSPGGSDRSYVTVTASNPSSPIKQPPVKSKLKQLNNKHIGNVNAICSKLNKSMNRSLHCASPMVMSKKKTTLTASDRKITDFFQVRKSSRKCKSDLEKEKRSQIEDAIRQGREEGLEVRTLDTKGRAIFATKPFARGEFVCEYAGELVPYKLAKKREEAYMRDPSIGCYMYFFEYKSTKHCVDATAESNRLGRLLNHSKLDGNCQTKIFEIKGRPHLILVAARDIKPGEEMTYDYGDRNQASLDAHPWLAT